VFIRAESARDARQLFARSLGRAGRTAYLGVREADEEELAAWESRYGVPAPLMVEAGQITFEPYRVNRRSRRRWAAEAAGEEAE